MADMIMGDFYLILAFQHFYLYEYEFPLWMNEWMKVAQ